MLDSFKRWIAKTPLGPETLHLSLWAKDHGHTFKTVRDSRGCVIECAAGERTWRLEWGEPQRRYIPESELRLRQELSLSPDVQLMLISRKLADQLEADVFDRYTEAMQTQVDHTLPEEMRWLAMFPKVNFTGPAKALKPHLLLLCANPTLAEIWLKGELADALQAELQGFLAGDPPFLIQMLRGRIYLRLGASHVTAEMLDGVNRVFEIAARRALECAGGPAGAEAVSGWAPSSQTAWQSPPSMMPSETVIETRDHPTSAH